MASVAFFHTCSVYHNVSEHVHNLPEKLLIEKVVAIVTIIFCSISLVGAIYLILPRDQTGSEWWRNSGRILVGPNLNQIIKAIVVTSFFGTLGILIRSSTLLGENLPHPGHELTSAGEFCIVINVIIQYFYQSSYFWIILYAMEVLMVSKNKEIPTALKYILGWILPGIVCAGGLLLLYNHGIVQYEGKSSVERGMLYFIFLFPIILVLFVNPVMFYYAAKAAKRALIWHYGRYTASERKLIDSIHFKFVLIMAAFLTSWLANVIDSCIHMADYRNRTAKLTIWIIMSVSNPLQPVLTALVLWGLPENNISFSTLWKSKSTNLSDITTSHVDFSRSTGSETEPLISFRRADTK